MLNYSPEKKLCASRLELHTQPITSVRTEACYGLQVKMFNVLHVKKYISSSVKSFEKTLFEILAQQQTIVTEAQLQKQNYKLLF